jgi:hypothetical protein
MPHPIVTEIATPALPHAIIWSVSKCHTCVVLHQSRKTARRSGHRCQVRKEKLHGAFCARGVDPTDWPTFALRKKVEIALIIGRGETGHARTPIKGSARLCLSFVLHRLRQLLLPKCQGLCQSLIQAAAAAGLATYQLGQKFSRSYPSPLRQGRGSERWAYIYTPLTFLTLTGRKGQKVVCDHFVTFPTY